MNGEHITTVRYRYELTTDAVGARLTSHLFLKNISGQQYMYGTSRGA